MFQTLLLLLHPNSIRSYEHCMTITFDTAVQCLYLAHPYTWELVMKKALNQTVIEIETDLSETQTWSTQHTSPFL